MDKQDTLFIHMMLYFAKDPFSITPLSSSAQPVFRNEKERQREKKSDFLNKSGLRWKLPFQKWWLEMYTGKQHELVKLPSKSVWFSEN